jgi:hypothetical protein
VEKIQSNRETVTFGIYFKKKGLRSARYIQSYKKIYISLSEPIEALRLVQAT